MKAISNETLHILLAEIVKDINSKVSIENLDNLVTEYLKAHPQEETDITETVIKIINDNIGSFSSANNYNFKIGTVTTVDSSQDAYVSVQKDDSKKEIILNFKIPKGVNGANGKSAYEIAVQKGFKGNETQWLESLKGKDGIGEQGEPGTNGKSAYEVAVENGFKGTVTEWLTSLKGDKSETLQLIGHAKEDVKAITYGWNLGNTFDATVTLNAGDKESLTRFNTDAEVPYYETCWGAHTTTADMFDLLKASGFNAVRVPITWAQHISITVNEKGKKTYTLSSKWIARLKEIVQMILSRDMYCIINTHHDDSNYQETVGQDVLLLTGWLNCDPESVDEVSTLFATVWQIIANEFKDFGDKLIFESFNELQNSKRNWSAPTLKEYRALNDLQQVFVNTVRATGGNNTTRTLCCQTHRGGFGNEEMIEPPVDIIENGIIWQVHDYSSEVDQSSLNSHYQYFLDNDMPLIVGEWGTQKNKKDSLPLELRAVQAQNFVAERAVAGIKCFWWDDDNSFELMDREQAEWNSETASIIKAIQDGYKGKKIPINYKIDVKKNDPSLYSYTAIDDNGVLTTTKDRDGLVSKDFIDITDCQYFRVVIEKGEGICVNCIALYDNEGNCLGVKRGDQSKSLLVEVNNAVKAKYYINNPWGYRSFDEYQDKLKNDMLSIKLQAF